MVTTIRARPAPPHRSRLAIWLALFAGLALVAALAVTVTLLISADDNPGTTGSGTTASDTRPLPAFTAVELAGTNHLTIKVGGTQQVTVRARPEQASAAASAIGVNLGSPNGSDTRAYRSR